MAFEAHQNEVMTNVLGRPVRLITFDPDARYARPREWPVLTGRVVAAAIGIHGLIWYLLETDEVLVPGELDPMRVVPEPVRSTSTRHFLLSPAPDMATDQIPKDYIGETIARHGVARVAVSIGPPPAQLPRVITPATDTYAWLCAGDLEAS
jgi:hypothetical protein